MAPIPESLWTHSEVPPPEEPAVATEPEAPIDAALPVAPIDAALAVAPIDAAPLAAPDQAAVWRNGEQVELLARDEAEAVGLFVLDVGSDWVPELFRSTPELPHAYEPMFVELSNGRFDDSYEGRRATQERYLEPFGIPPSPALLSRRFEHLAGKPCSTQLSLEPLYELEGADQGDEVEPISQTAIDALQTRLVCEEHLRRVPSGEFDADTRAALEEFDRRNRIYARGELQGETLAALRLESLELERAALVRVLTERMLLDLGVIEDGSALDALPDRGSDRVEAAPDVVRRVEQRIIEAFGLQSVDGLRKFYGRLRDGLTQPHYGVAIDAIELPDYYGNDMDLWVEIDRGDLYYEFPFHEDGTPIDLPVERLPTLTLFARDAERRVRPLARYRTTIGGWRLRRHRGQDYWAYKESPVGSRVWARVVSAPVWLPPATTPQEQLVVTMRRTADGTEYRELNQSLIGPSFGSAYGLVAAHHRRFGQASDGDFELRGDDGFRTHGSGDYTSIGRLSSSGCHRLHNHLALRLFNFILAHRPHHRTGHRAAKYRLPVLVDGFSGQVNVTRTGYGFDLEQPVEVQVLPGRVRGNQKRATHAHIPARPRATTPRGPGAS